MSEGLAGIADFLFEAGTLKNQRRTGWWLAGIKDPESIAEHSWRTALIASVLAGMEGADPARAALLAVWHDTQESRTGDIPHLGRRYLDAADPKDVTKDQIADMPEPVAAAISRFVGEYEDGTSLEAICARDADKLECLVQGLEYRDQGHANVQRWIDNSATRLKTDSANRLAEELLRTGSLDWLRKAMNEH